jgi:CheY-like chemotaxis protein
VNRPPPASQGRSGEARGYNDGHGQQKVLVVDDHVPTRSLIRTILEAEKSDTYDVIEAGTGTDCLRAADRDGPFDLILLDVTSPTWTATRSAVRYGASMPSPIVFVTAKGDLKDYTAGATRAATPIS